MATAPQARVSRGPVAIDRRAADNLRFIRDTMERASAFTAVPGWGGVAIGWTAIIAGLFAEGRPLRSQFFIWLAEGVIAAAIGSCSLRWKARRVSLPLASGPGKRVLLSFAPPLIAGGVLTVALFEQSHLEIFAGLWLLLYGVAVTTAGAFSVRIVPVMGLCFMGMGTLAVLASPHLANWFMIGGFGVLHVVFGYVIARRYGG